jgi:hypothetical protein
LAAGADIKLNNSFDYRLSALRQSCENVLGLANASNELVPAETHDGSNSEQDDTRTETLGGQVSLFPR